MQENGATHVFLLDRDTATQEGFRRVSQEEREWPRNPANPEAAAAPPPLSRTRAREGVDTYRLDPTALRKVHILQAIDQGGRGEDAANEGRDGRAIRGASVAEFSPPGTERGTHPVEETGMEVMRIESLVLRHCSLESVCAVCTVAGEQKVAAQLENPGHGDARNSVCAAFRTCAPRQRPLTLRN